MGKTLAQIKIGYISAVCIQSIQLYKLYKLVCYSLIHLTEYTVAHRKKSQNQTFQKNMIGGRNPAKYGL